MTTPFGEPSGPYVLGTLRGKRVAFLARHGAGHRLMPSELNFRANIFGFKQLGVTHLLSASAVGSLKEEYRPLDLVFPDQFFDRTHGPRQHLLRRRAGRPRRLRAPGVRSAARRDGRCRRRRRRHRASRRHLRVHGGAAVLDAGRVEPLPRLGHGRHRHDQPAGGQAGPRGGDLLRDDGAGHRLRLLASRSRQRDRRDDHRQPDRRTPPPPSG